MVIDLIDALRVFWNRSHCGLRYPCVLEFRDGEVANRNMTIFHRRLQAAAAAPQARGPHGCGDRRDPL